MDQAKMRGIGWQLAAYGTALFVAVATYNLSPLWPLIPRFFFADVMATIVIFGFSRASGNSSFYDPYWSIQPIVIAVALSLYFNAHISSTRSWVVLGLVAFWGLRLTFNFFRGWRGLKQQDWRYDDLQKKHGRAYWWVSFSGIHLLPTVLVFAGCLCLFAVYTYATRSWNGTDIVATVLTLAAVLLEMQADNQLHRYKQSHPAPNSTLSSGWWAWVRHPNYLGEISFWWGLYLFALAANPAFWWTVIGPLSITLLFVFISIPMIDRRMLAKRPGYKAHMHNIPALIPRFRRSR